MSYTKQNDSNAIDDGWTVRDETGHVVAHLDTETMADALIECLDGVIRRQLIDAAQDANLCRNVRVECTGASLDIYVDGYGNHGMEPGCSSVAALEIYEGRLRLLVWGDMNNESPDIVDLEGANESNRPPDEEE